MLMKSQTKAFLISVLSLFLFIASCGGGGVSEGFTREINEFETAWNNTTTSLIGIIDSVKTTNDQWVIMNSEMKIPDTLVEKIGDSKSKILDSVKLVCSSQNQGCTSILKELETFQLGWNKETKSFEEWKDKVLKGEIDIETAKNDLKIYKSKLTDAGNKSTESYNKLSDLKVACAGNCGQYASMLQKFSLEEAEPEKRGR